MMLSENNGDMSCELDFNPQSTKKSRQKFLSQKNHRKIIHPSFCISSDELRDCRGWSGGAKVLGKLSVLGCPTIKKNLDCSRTRAYCACSRWGWGLFGHFFSGLSLLSSFSLLFGEGPIWTEILSERAVKPKRANQPKSKTASSGLMLFANSATLIFRAFRAPVCSLAS